eukprot:TRINITY_DN2268_c0_g1_i1.p1 TRINITY_DN2268_c0_g1~~TRINITY_DN2268_c0_g1_i1.p1  ORF type:complete len:779 (-),score=235.82 TRINITY_DN2268_c0_g1_i1:3400-5388(-)
MINNRNKSIVADMKWSSDGKRICIAYEDGMVIMGSVEGNRIWAKEFKSQLRLVQWPPDNSSLLLVTAAGDVQKYDPLGNPIGKVFLGGSEGIPVVSMDWYDGAGGFVDVNCPTFAVAFENGVVQILASDTDTKPVSIRSGVSGCRIKWNGTGTVLAVAGTYKDSSCVVQFYSPYGEQLRTLKVPGTTGITAVAWEGGDLRVALAMDSFIFFANVRPSYHWAYFAHTLVYAFPRPDTAEISIMFWNLKSDEKHLRRVKKFVSVYAKGDRCVLVSKSEEVLDQWVLIMCNSCGSLLDTHYLDMQPKFITMTETHVIVANESFFFVWQYQEATNTEGTAVRLLPLEKRESKDILRHIDDIEDSKANVNLRKPNNDPITAICARDNVVCIARQRGGVLQYTLPRMIPCVKYNITCQPAKIAINSNLTRLGIIDTQNVLTFCEMESPNAPLDPAAAKRERKEKRAASKAAATAKAGGATPRKPAAGSAEKPSAQNAWRAGGKQITFERKDVWDFRWAEDVPELCAVMEKTRMYIFRNTDPEDSVMNSGYVARFKNLKVKSAFLDEIMRTPDKPDKEMVFSYETIILRETMGIVENKEMTLDDAVSFVNTHPHPRLWKMLAEAALNRLDFQYAEKGFVRCKDYRGIYFVKRLRILDVRGTGLMPHLTT